MSRAEGQKCPAEISRYLRGFCPKSQKRDKKFPFTVGDVSLCPSTFKKARSVGTYARDSIRDMRDMRDIKALFSVVAHNNIFISRYPAARSFRAPECIRLSRFSAWNQACA